MINMSAQSTFSEIQNLAKKFLERGHLLTLKTFLGYIGSDNEKRLLRDRDFLMNYLNMAMKRGRFETVIDVLKSADNARAPVFLSLWDEAHYSLEPGQSGSPLTPIQKFRIRSRNPPPPGVCAGGVRPKKRMGYDEKRVLVSWLKQHREHPYLTHADKTQLASETGLTDNQVATWFANARRRLKKKPENQDNRQAKRKRMTNSDEGKTTAVHHTSQTLARSDDHTVAFPSLSQESLAESSDYSQGLLSEGKGRSAGNLKHLKRFAEEKRSRDKSRFIIQQYNRERQETCNNYASSIEHCCYNLPAVVSTPVEREPFSLIKPKPLQNCQNVFCDKSEVTYVVERLASLRPMKSETGYRPLLPRVEINDFPRSGEQPHHQVSTVLVNAPQSQEKVPNGNQAFSLHSSFPVASSPLLFQNLSSNITGTTGHRNTNLTALQAYSDGPRWTQESIWSREKMSTKYHSLTEAPVDASHVLEALQTLCDRVSHETVSPRDAAIMLVRNETGKGQGERTSLAEEDEEGGLEDVYMAFNVPHYDCRSDDDLESLTAVRELQACWNQPVVQEPALENQTTGVDSVDLSYMTEPIDLSYMTEQDNFSAMTELEVGENGVLQYPMSHYKYRTEELGCHGNAARREEESSDCVITHVEKPATMDYGTTVLGEAIQGLLNLSSPQGSATDTDAVWSGHRLP